jgi:hypothetical protein
VRSTCRAAPPAVETGSAELDGCLRILAPDGTLRQGTHDLAALLATG